MLGIFNTFGLTNEGKVKTGVVIGKLEEHCTPKKNITYERHVFNTRAQGATKGIDANITELRKLARNCEFGELHNSIIRDRTVCGIRSNKVRKRLLREKDLNFERAVEMCKSPEITEHQAKNIVVDQDDRDVHNVKDDSKKPPGKLRGARESTSKQRNRSTVKDVDKCTNLKNAQPMVRFATNANKGIITRKCASPSQGTALNK